MEAESPKYLKNRPGIEKKVSELLISKPPTRGDDLLLIYYYWRAHSTIRISFSQFKDILYAPCPESIRRSRQKIQAAEQAKKDRGEPYDERLLPTERVKRKRAANEEEHRSYYRKNTRVIALGQKELSSFSG